MYIQMNGKVTGAGYQNKWTLQASMTPRKPSKRSAQAPNPPVQLDSPRSRKTARTSNSVLSSKHKLDPRTDTAAVVSAAAASKNPDLIGPCQLADRMHDLECLVVDIVRILQSSGTVVKIEEAELKRMSLARKTHEAGLERIQQAQKDQQVQHSEFDTLLARADAGLGPMEEIQPKDLEDSLVQYVPPGCDSNSTLQQQPQQLASLLPAAQSLPQQLPQQLPRPTYHLQLLQAVQQLQQLVQQCQDSHVLLPSVQWLVQCVHQQLPPNLQVHLDTQQWPQPAQEQQVPQQLPQVAHTMVQQQQQQRQQLVEQVALQHLVQQIPQISQQLLLATQQEVAQQLSQVTQRPSQMAQEQVVQLALQHLLQQIPQISQQLLLATQQEVVQQRAQVTQQPPRLNQQQVVQLALQHLFQQIPQITQQLLLAAQQERVQQLAQATQQPQQVTQQQVAQQQVTQHQVAQQQVARSNAAQMASAADNSDASRGCVASQLCKHALHGLLQPVQHRQQQFQADAQQPLVTAAGGIAPGALVAVSRQNGQRQPKPMHPFPMLKAFQTIAQLYRVVTHGDEMSGILSFTDREKADPDWVSGSFQHRQRYREIVRAIDEIHRQAEVAGVAPSAIAAQMDADRLTKKNKGVSGYVQELLAARPQMNKGAKAALDAPQLQTAAVPPAKEY